MKSTFWKLEKLGQMKLSQHFQMRQFLYSEIAAAYNISNITDDKELAIEAGQKLCDNILEPLTEKFGSIIIRSGFRSATLNDFGNKHGLKCASNEKNYAYHIWDHRDNDEYIGAAACIVIPAINKGKTKFKTWQDLAFWIDENLPYHSLTFFKKDNAFNIGWHENPKREIFSRNPKPHWLKKN